MDKILKTTDDGRFRVWLKSDEDCPNPREDYEDNIIHAVSVPYCAYKARTGSTGPLSDGWDQILRHPDAVEIFTRWARIFHGAVVLHETPTHGPDVIWYILPDKFGEVPDPAKALEEVQQNYREWVDGQTYGYVIEQAVTYAEVGGDRTVDQWEAVDDCWGLIGFEYARQTALEAWADHTDQTA